MGLPSIGVPRELLPWERRVALDPAAVTRLVSAGHAVVVEHGAGEGAWWTDEAYRAAGAAVAPRHEVLRDAAVVTVVHPVPLSELHRGQILIGLLGALADPPFARACADAGVDAVSLDLLPRTVSSAQSMDALTSQANVAGYKAAVLAADLYGGFFPLLMTAAGTVRPATVLVLGGGVAGLAAIGTAARLGAVVTGYDVRPEARADIESVGARFLPMDEAPAGVGEGGYARALTASEAGTQQDALGRVLPSFDVVIATAAVPGRRPPVLVTAEALSRMRPGSVVVDAASSGRGGNVDGSRPGETFTTSHGVTVVGADDLPARMPTAASAAYARNLTALLALLDDDGGDLDLDGDDAVRRGVVVTRAGVVVQPAVAALLDQGVHDEPQPVH